MTVALSNSFEGGTNGTAITTGNSGGASGDAFSSVQTSLGVPKFSNAHAHGGSMAMAIAQGASWDSFPLVIWSMNEPTVYVRMYVWIPPAMVGSGNNWVVCQGLGGAEFTVYCPASGQGSVSFSTSGGSGFSGSGAVAVTLAPSKWFRIEAMISTLPGPWGSVQMRAFTTTPESDNPSGDSGQNLLSSGTPAATTTSVSFGAGQKWGGIGAFLNDTGYIDDVAVSTAGWIGPSGAVSRVIPGITGGLRDRLVSSGTKRTPGTLQRSLADYKLLARDVGPVPWISGGSTRPLAGQTWPPQS
jgi:hypothetical protein